MRSLPGAKLGLRTVLLERENPTDGNRANESPRSQHARPRRPTPNLQLVPIVNSARLVVPSGPLFAAIVGRHALLRLGDQAHCPRTPDRPGKLSLLLGTDLQRNGVQQSSESRLKPTSSLVCASPPSLAAAPRFLYLSEPGGRDPISLQNLETPRPIAKRGRTTGSIKMCPRSPVKNTTFMMLDQASAHNTPQLRLQWQARPREGNRPLSPSSA